MDNPLLQQPLLGLLKDVEAALKAYGVDFYLIGAIARDYHLSAHPDLQSFRKTRDVDFAIMLNDAGQFNEIKASLLASGNFEADPQEPVKLFYKHQLEVDLLPFGEIENDKGYVFLQPPNLFTVNFPGFKAVYPFVENVQVDDDFVLKVCPLEGIVILKLIAYDQDLSRAKDIEDISHMVGVYFELADEQIYFEYSDVMDLYDTDHPEYLNLIAARVIGRKMQAILEGAEELRRMVIGVLQRRAESWASEIVNGLEDRSQAIVQRSGR
ncbi:nucleotidyl transferase AbiEii/AbiGii toxin family protein [Pedobacter sp. GR22-6]|uniref:nucleotidyl transferase AbiEii/AbiGii toxin family protein n=1 Tax=Pedobacter sp. GR22-6 TaxID=3127957 RepID=UPI00307FB423